MPFFVACKSNRENVIELLSQSPENLSSSTDTLADIKGSRRTLDGAFLARSRHELLLRKFMHAQVLLKASSRAFRGYC
jgi:hypothetical protein